VTAHPAIADRVVAQQEVDWPGGETAHEVAARAQVAADRVLAAIAQDRAVVAVSHGGILGAVLPLITTMPAPPHLDPGSALAIDPASM
jgi:broad specificity phosphatase PhoE